MAMASGMTAFRSFRSCSVAGWLSILIAPCAAGIAVVPIFASVPKFNPTGPIVDIFPSGCLPEEVARKEMQILGEERGVPVDVQLRLQGGVTADVAGSAIRAGNDDRSGGHGVESVLVTLAPVEGPIWCERQPFNRIQSERRL